MAASEPTRLVVASHLKATFDAYVKEHHLQREVELGLVVWASNLTNDFEPHRGQWLHFPGYVHSGLRDMLVVQCEMILMAGD